MPDITMCQNHDCKRREECYRYNATPSMRQSYAAFSGEGGCDYYVPMWPEADVPDLSPVGEE